MWNEHGGDVYTHPDVIDFSANINPIEMPEAVMQAIRESLTGLMHYPDCECRALRTKLAEREHCPADAVICGNGAAELLYTLALALRPKHALLLSPCFAEYEDSLRVCDSELHFYELKKENRFRLQEDYLELLTEEIDVAYLCSPNNPTGQTIDRKLLAQIIRVCGQKHIFLVLDACFMEFLDPKEQPDLIQEIFQKKHIFILRSFTKMFGLAGIRLGYGICTDTDLLARMQYSRQPWPVSTPAQAAGIAACREEEFVIRSREYLKKERLYLEAELRPLVKTLYPSKANYLLFEAEEDLQEKLLSHGILIRDCSNYRGLGKGFFRVAVKSHADNERLIRAMEQVAERSRSCIQRLQ
ncbi:MAG: threonine-phosphate decarboxylase CobD [Lachnospiraceae bacterium]|nr:threonine-phosphate decarboxylase CobD [Lachnospiraceae bacterium]